MEFLDAVRAMCPVFIVGAPRSGTSILYRKIQEHPTFSCDPPNPGDGDLQYEHLRETNIVRWLPNVPWYQHEEPYSLWAYMFGDQDRFDAFLASVHSLDGLVRKVRRLHSWMKKATMARYGWPVRLTPYHLVARRYFYFAQQARGCLRLVEKTPHHILDVPLLRRAFPSARFLYIHRHPVDVYSSYVRRAQQKTSASWAQLSPQEFVDLYRKQSSHAMDLATRHPDRLKLVDYERFTQDHHSELQSVFEFLGEPFDPVMLRPNAVPSREERWDDDPLLFGDVKQRTKKWQSYVETETASEIENTLGHVMRALGHDRYTRDGVR